MHPPSGIAARQPAEEWSQDVLDRPFGWGVLIPWLIAPSSLATEALKLLEILLERHPQQETEI